eukprot:286993-Prymnesium_polylepis.2
MGVTDCTVLAKYKCTRTRCGQNLTGTFASVMSLLAREAILSTIGTRDHARHRCCRASWVWAPCPAQSVARAGGSKSENRPNSKIEYDTSA